MKLQDVVVHSVVVSVLATEEDIFADRLPCDHIVSMEGVLDKNFTTNYDVEVLRPLAVPIKLLIPVEEDQVAHLEQALQDQGVDLVEEMVEGLQEQMKLPYAFQGSVHAAFSYLRLLDQGIVFFDWVRGLIGFPFQIMSVV